MADFIDIRHCAQILIVDAGSRCGFEGSPGDSALCAVRRGELFQQFRVHVSKQQAREKEACEHKGRNEQAF